MAPLDDDSTDRPREPGFGAESALRALEDRLERASDAAERLITEAVNAARRTPPSGWAAPGGDSEDASAGAADAARDDGKRSDDDLATIVSFVRSLRDLVPPDLQRRLAEALRELLLALRALIDWYLERVEQRRKTPTPVEDIPIL
jgi:hypothetical protein